MGGREGEEGVEGEGEVKGAPSASIHTSLVTEGTTDDKERVALPLTFTFRITFRTVLFSRRSNVPSEDWGIQSLTSLPLSITRPGDLVKNFNAVSHNHAGS